MAIQQTSKTETFVKRVIAATMRESSTDGNKFTQAVADAIADECISEVSVNESPIINADIGVFATVDLSNGRSVTNSRCLDLFEFEIEEFWGLTYAYSNGEYSSFNGPIVKFKGRDSDGKTYGMHLRVQR